MQAQVRLALNHFLRRKAIFSYSCIIAFLTLIIACKEQKTDAGPAVVILPATDTVQQDLSFLEKRGDAWVVPWSILTKVRFENGFNDKLGIEVNIPIFNDTLRALAGQKVIVEGYFIPVDETGDASIVILSAFPYANCFFCGNAGVETIIDVLGTKDLPKLKLDSRINFKGTLRLNSDDFNYLIYILDDAEYLGK